MSTDVTPVEEENQPTGTTPSSSTTGNPKPTSNPEVNMSTSFHSLDELQKRAPQLFSKFMEAIAQNVISDMKKGSDRIRTAMKKMRQDNQ